MSGEPVADFIEVYDGVLTADACAAIVRDLQASPALQPGRIGSGVFPELKRSRDLALRGQPEWATVEAALNQAVFAGLLAYVRTYPQTLIAPLMLQQPGIGSVPQRLDADALATMDDAALAPLVSAC